MSTRHSSTARSWSSRPGHRGATTVRVPARSERSAIAPSPRLCDRARRRRFGRRPPRARRRRGRRRASPRRRPGRGERPRRARGAARAWRRSAASSERRSRTDRTGAPLAADTRAPAAGRPPTRRRAGSVRATAPNRSATSSRSSSPAPPPPRRRVDAHRRTAERTERVPQVAVEAAGLLGRRARPSAGTPWRRTRGTTRRAVPARRSARGPPDGQRARRRREGRRHALPASDHRPVGVVDDLVERRCW